jgi:hypothetical protein
VCDCLGFLGAARPTVGALLEHPWLADAADWAPAAAMREAVAAREHLVAAVQGAATVAKPATAAARADPIALPVQAGPPPPPAAGGHSPQAWTPARVVAPRRPLATAPSRGPRLLPRATLGEDAGTSPLLPRTASLPGWDSSVTVAAHASRSPAPPSARRSARASPYLLRKPTPQGPKPFCAAAARQLYGADISDQPLLGPKSRARPQLHEEARIPASRPTTRRTAAEEEARPPGFLQRLLGSVSGGRGASRGDKSEAAGAQHSSWGLSSQ